jgi:ribosomal protein L11 methyltransferase
VSAESSPALIIHLTAGHTAAARERLVALLSDYDLLAIHEDDPATPRTWTAHFGTADARAGALQAIGSIAGTEPLRVELADVEDDDWARRTQADLPAIRVGRIIVAPPWDLPTADLAAGALVVEIEPSRGFGTGHHQSTRLCLVLLQSHQLDSRTVIDVGTGSGVLAIAAAKLGAAFVSAFDADPDAVENARENIVTNRVAPTVEAHVRDLTEPGLPAADVVTANLTGTLLARHATELGALVKTGGSLIVAGFTIDEKRLVLDAFEASFALTQSAEEDDWWAFVLTRTPRN